MGMRILVTGAAGFVGTHLARELKARNWVYSSDIDYADLSQPGIAENLVKQVTPDYVVHLAARYGRLLCRDEPHRSVSDNAAATTEIAAVCAERGIPVLYTSSSEVYGDHGQVMIDERSELRMPTTIYGLSKRWGEEALRLYMPPENLCIVRMNMLFGDGQRGGYGRCSLATFIQQALAGETFTVHRNASRSWLYISDAVRALRLLIEGGHHGIFNLGNDYDQQRSMEGVGDAVVAAAGGEYELADAPPTQIRHKAYSSAKLRNTIDWQPQVELFDGIRRTVEAQRKDAECLSDTRS